MVDWRLLLFVAYRRARRPAALAVLVGALIFAGMELPHLATARCCTLVVTGYNLDTSSPNHLIVQANDRIVAVASTFDGTIVGPERARFVLPPGIYTLFVSNDVASSTFSFSGSPQNLSITIHLDHDVQVDMRQLILQQRADAGRPGFTGR